MKKLLIVLLLVCVGLLIADPIPVGEGEETNTHLPMEAFYGYTYSQTIYTAEEIGGAVNIENVAWHYNGYSAWTEDEVVIYMGHTTMTDFGDTYPNWIPVTELTEVYSGPFSVLDFDHWVTMELTNTFAYNGTDNLVIAFDANTSGYHSSMAEFYGTMTASNRSTYYYSDSTNPDPADPPATRGEEYYEEDEAIKTGKTLSRVSGVQAYIANIILNNDATLPSGFVNGYVYDSADNAPIEGATVNVGSFVGMSDAMGFYEIEVLVEGEHAVTATHPDYFAADAGMVTVVFDQTSTVDIYMDINDLQGDQPGTAMAINAFPFFDTGDTSLGYTNFIGNTSADVFYTFTLTEELLMDIHCCGSTFDTYLRLYDDTMSQVTYDDDGCSSWPTGSSTASWIGDGAGVTVPAGTYYVCLEGWSSNTGYYELTVEEWLPPEYGNIDGTVTEDGTGTPIEGATVNFAGLTATTDASGYYSIMDIETGIYNLTVSADGYFGGAVQDVEIFAEQTTTVDVALDPIPYGNIDGTVTDFATGLAIAGAEVSCNGLMVYTDAAGYYLFEHLEAGLYNVDVYATGYNPDGAVDVEVLMDQTTTVDFALEEMVGVIFEMTVDSWPSETSWNVWNADESAYVWAEDLTFTTGGETVILAEDLANGNYEVHCFDTFGDGGIAGIVSKEGVVLVQWARNDYTTDGVFPFVVGDILFGSLEGTVTNSFTTDGVNGAVVTCGTYQGVTDETGFYSIPDVLVGTYTVVCSAIGYTDQEVMDVEILEDNVTTLDFALDIVMEAPTGLTAVANGYDVSLAWEAPYIPPANQIIYDDGEAENATAWYDPGNERAVWFTATGGDCVVTGGSMHIYDGTWPTGNVLTPFTAIIWAYDAETGLPGEQLGSVEVTPTGYEWVGFTFDTPIAVPGGNFCLGYAQGGTYPDCAPVSIDETLPTVNRSFEHETVSGLDWAVSSYQDFMIRAALEDDEGREIVVSYENPVIDISNAKESARSLSLYDAAVPQTNNARHTEVVVPVLREFTGEYNVYRNDVVIATVTETTYEDMSLLAGIYEYYVTAVHVEGESPETNHVTVELGEADVAVDPAMISETLDYGLTADHTITLSNNGDGNFYWTGSIVNQERFDVGETKPRTAGSVNENAELCADAEMFEVPENRDMWDILYSEVIGADIVAQAGVEFDGTYIYTAVWNSNTINKYDIDGNFIESFTIEGVSGLRDLAYDGTYFYGGAAGTQIWEMDFNTQTLVSTITSPVAVRAIAYDDDADGFWVNNWGTDVTLVGRDGSIMNSFPCSATYGSWYGMAYDNVTDGGPYIYGFSQDGSGCVINQMSIATGADTGVMRDVFADTGSITDDIAGGLFTTVDYASGVLSIGALNQSSYTLTVYELSPYSNWLAIEPSSGTLAPGESVTVTATFDACELPGLTYYADIVFTDGEAMATVAADLTITGSIPTPEMTVTPEEFDVIVSADGTLDQALTIGNAGDLALEYDAEIIYYEGRATAEVYPQSADYWTGSFDAASFTSTSAINLVDVEDGWAMFDVSGIPDGAVINSIEANVYVSDTYYPWWSITPCTMDPLTTDAATLAGHIIGNEGSGVAYSYNNESSTFVPGWYTYPLGGTANADLEAALSNDWFACGFTSRDNSASFYVCIDGWNEANPPYLMIDYSIPINPWVTFDGDMTMDGMVEVGAGANAHNLHFDALGLVDGDVMMGEIVLNSNDLYNEEIIIPLTMTVGAPYMYGDVTGDEIVDAFDAANVLQYTVGMDPVGAPLPWTWQMMAGDVDGNGTPEAYDAALVLQYAVGMIDVFPVEARCDAPVADVTMTVEAGELVFTTTGDLYGFSVSTETELISFGETEIEYLHAVNGNAIALANAEAIDGEFLRIPFEKAAESGEFVITTTANGVSSDNTYNVEDLESAPAVNAVLGNYPNPFNPSTVIKLQVKEATPVTVNVYNVKGQLVKSLVNETLPMGIHEVEWNGTDNHNRATSTGVYFYNVKIGELNETHKMIMLK